MSAKPLLALIIFLLSFTVVVADMQILTYPTTSDFTVSGNYGDISLCQCSSSVDQFIVTNDGAYSSKYSVDLSGSEYASLVGSGFELFPGQSHPVIITYSVPCGTDVSDELSLRITDIFGHEQTITKRLTGVDCPNLQATLMTMAGDSVKPCEAVDYAVGIENTGVYTETYEVSFGGKYSGYFVRNGTLSVVVPAGQKAIVENSLTLDCSMSGEFTIPFHVEAVDSGYEADLEHKLLVDPDYGFSAEVTAQDDYCALDDSTIPLMISNDGAVENTYDVRVLSGNDVFSIAEGDLTIAPSQSGVVEVSFSPDTVGNRTLNISITSKLGDDVKFISVPLKVVSCYGLDLKIEQQQDIWTCSGIKQIPFSLYNLGSKPVVVNLSVTGSDIVSVVDSVKLDAFEFRPMNFTIDAPADASLRDNVVLLASIDGKPVSAQDAIGVRTFSDEDCYRVKLVEDHVKLLYGTENAYFDVVHKGLEGALYEVTYEGDPWLSVSEDSRYLEISPGQEDVKVKLNTYQVPENVSKNHYEGVITLIAYTGDKSIDYEFPVLVTMHDRALYLRAYDYFSRNPCHFATVALVVIMIVLLFALAFIRRKYERNPGLLGLLLLLWVVAVVASFLVYGLPAHLYDEVPVSHDSMTIIMQEDSVYTLNLSDYFIDPDGDELTYTIDPIDNVKVRIDGPIASFIPEKDWYGSRRFRINAYDGRSGATPSPTLSLEVVDKYDYTPWTLYQKYCLVFNLFLLLLVALLVYSVAARRTKVPPAPKVGVGSGRRRASARRKVAKKRAGSKKKVSKKKNAKRSKD